MKTNKHAVHYSSKSDEWGTPQELVDPYIEAFGLVLDVCARPYNAKLPQFYDGAKVDALMQVWHEHVEFLDGDGFWMNPPFGRQIIRWMAKAHAASRHVNAICLVPARTDTRWWHLYVQPIIQAAMNNDERRLSRVEFLPGRVKFERPGFKKRRDAPFPTAIVVMRPSDWRLREVPLP